MSLVSADPPNARRSSGRTMCRSASSAAIAPRRLELDPVALVVIDRQRDDRKAPLARDAGADHRIEPAGQQDDGAASQLDARAAAPPRTSRRKAPASRRRRSPCSPRSRLPTDQRTAATKNSGSDGRKNQKVLTDSSATRSGSPRVAPQPDHRQQRRQRQRSDQPAPAGIAPRDLRHRGDDRARKCGLDDEVEHGRGALSRADRTKEGPPVRRRAAQ